VSVRTRVDRRGIFALSCGHACVDVAQGAVPALLPFFVHDRGYSYAAASALLLAVTLGSSLIQPLFGHLADARSLPWLLPGGVLVAGLGISLAGVTSSYPLTFALIALAGLGVGAYHPEAARYANYVSGERRATGMSLFSVGGNIGFALGPILVTPLVLLLGLSGTVWLALPFLVIAFGLVRSMPYLQSFRPGRDDADTGDVADDRWRPFSMVAAIAGFRSGAYFGLQAFVPAYFIAHLGTSAGRIGRRAVLVGCMAVLTPVVLLLLVSGPLVGYLLMGIAGFFAVGTFSVTVVLGQEFLPGRIGIASGVTLGAAIGIGGITTALLGILADHAGLTPVLLVVAAFPLPALALSLALPRA
jgi:MFS transporter, FSR family, fosmidomycin resistance protein